jgi:predicted kinase
VSPIAQDAGRPRITLITGAPGSGKTTLGAKVSRALQIPFIARDDVRRGLFFTAGGWTERPGPVPTSEQSVEVFLRLLETTASLGVSAVAEHVFGRDRHDDLERLTTAAECVVIITKCRRALDRFEERHRGDRLINRRPVLEALGYATVEDHTADALARMRSVATQMRTKFDVPSLLVDTEDGYTPGFEEILDFVTGVGAQV